MITTLNDIDLSSDEGKLAFVALCTLSTTIYWGKEPDAIIAILNRFTAEWEEQKRIEKERWATITKSK